MYESKQKSTKVYELKTRKRLGYLFNSLHLKSTKNIYNANKSSTVKKKKIKKIVQTAWFLLPTSLLIPFRFIFICEYFKFALKTKKINPYFLFQFIRLTALKSWLKHNIYWFAVLRHISKSC